MGYTLDPAGKPEYSSTPTQTVADLQAAVEYAEKVGGVLRDLSSVRSLLSSDEVSVGMLFVETDTGAIYKRTASGWDLVWDDSGWQVVTPSGTGFTPFGPGIRFRRIGQVVFFNVSASNPSWGVGNWAIAPIPVGFRPATTMAFASTYDDVAKEIQFTSAGAVVAAKAGTGGVSLSGSYPLG